MKWRREKNASHFTFCAVFTHFLLSFLRRKNRKSSKALRQISQREMVEKSESRRKKQIHLKSFVIKSKLTFRAKLCYPPNLHFSLTNTEKKREKERERKIKAEGNVNSTLRT